MQKFTLPAGTTNRHQWHKATLAAISDLDRVRFQRRELYGVKGGEERESIISTMFAGVENETADQLLNNIGDSFGWAITKENADQITGAIKESMQQAIDAIPVDDNREEPNEKTERMERARLVNEQHEKEQAEKNAQTKIHIDELHALYPWAMADNGKISGYARAAKNMKKELSLAFPYIKFSVTSDSFSMGNSISVRWDNGVSPATVDAITDKYAYYIDKCTDDNSSYSNAVGSVLGQSKYVSTQRNIDRSIKDLIEADIRAKSDTPDHAISDLVWRAVSGVDITGRYTGIELVNGEYVAQFEVEPEPEPPKPTTKPAEGVTISEGTRAGFTQIEFSGKPSADIRTELKSAGYRWSPKNSVWYGKTDLLPSRYQGGEPVTAQAAPVANGERFRSLADGMQGTIDNKLGDRLTNTPKRVAQAAHSRLDGEKLKRTQQALYALADMQDAGTVPQVLQGLTSKKAIFDLMGEEKTPCANGYHSYYVGTGEPVHTTPQAVALWALLTGKTEEEKQAEELKRKIEGLQFSNIAGYFPTPDPVIDTMIDYAQLEEHHKVLEPELGSCAIADRIAPLVASVEGFEINHTLSEIADAKGYLLNKIDFLHVDQPNPVDSQTWYDRIMMNPPFENLQDVDHVMHAFRFLKSGGRLVSVMAPSWTYNKQKKAEAFRQWVDKNGGEVVELEAGSFKESGTGTNTILLIVDKG